MADFIGRALVQIKADTTGFQRDARKKIQDALNPIKATVTITPSTVGFQAELRKQVRNAINTSGKFELPVTPELGTFRQRFAAELRREPVAIPVVPDMSLFRAQLETKVAEVNRGLLVKIPVVAGTEADFLPGKPKQGGKPTEEDKAAAAAAKQRAEEDARLREVERTLGPIEKSRAEATALVNRALREGLDDEERANLLRESLAASSSALTKNEIALSAARKTNDRELVKTLTTTQARIASERQFTKQQLQNTAATAAITKTQDAYNKAIAIEIKTLSSSSAIQEARTALKTADKRITDLLTSSELNLSKAQIEQFAGMQGEIRARQQLIATQAKQIKSQAALSSQEKLLARGAGATGLSLLGVRGATLAASGAFLVGAAAVATFAKSVFSAAQLETSLNVLGETSNATAEELKRASEVAIQLGEDITLPGVTATDAAEAFTTLAKAGLSVEDALKGARGVLQLATAAQITNAEATELVASALNAFSLSGEQAVHVADLLANAANAAQGSITDMGIAMQQSAAVGRQVGLSLEDLSVFLTILAKSGLRGSDAGTSLRTALIRLVSPTDKAREKIEELGIQIRDAEGNLRVDIFQQLAAATADLSPAARDATLALLGGQDALRAFTILGRQSIQSLLKFRAELRQQGSAADLAAARTKGLQGSALALANTFQTLGTSLGQRVDPALTSLTNSTTASIQALTESEGVAAGLNATFAGVGETFSALGSILATVGPIILSVAGAFGQLAADIGGLPILATFAAFKFGPTIFNSLNSVLTVTQGRWRDMAAEMKKAQIVAAASGAPFSRLGFALRNAGAAIAAFAASATGMTIAAAAIAGGLFLFFTRTTESERAARRLKEATDALTDSFSRSKIAASDLADAQRGAVTANFARAQNELAVVQARQALASSTAAANTIQRREAELNLQIAIQNSTFAEDDYRAAIKRTSDAQEVAAQAARNLKAARDEESLSIQAVVAAERSSRGLFVGEEGKGNAEAEAAALRDVVEQFQKRAEAAREVGTAESIAFAKRLELLSRFSEAIRRTPTEKEIEIVLTAPNIKKVLDDLSKAAGEAGFDSKEAFIKFFTKDLPAAKSTLVRALRGLLGGNKDVFGDQALIDSDHYLNILARNIETKGAEVLKNAIGTALRNAQGQIQGLERQELDIRIAGGSDQEILANLRRRAELQRGRISRLERLGAAEETIRAEKEELAGILDRIRSLEESIASDAKAKADDIKKARDEADDAVVKAFGREEDRVQSLLIRAQGTESLRDDIKFKTVLRTILQNQIRRANDLIKNLEARRDFQRETRRRVLDLTNQIKQDRKALNDQLKKNAQERLQRIQESIELDIELASIRENVTGEIRARERLIANLRKQQRKVKEGTVEYKRLRNAIAAEQKAIEELRGQKKDENKAMASLQFEFLQSQKGFFANFFGNVLPIGSTAGLVGNVETGTAAATAAAAGGAGGGKIKIPHGAAVATGPMGPINQAAARAEGRGGPTRGQAATEVELLRQVVMLLSQIAARDKNPEAKRSRIHAGGRMETV